MKSLLLSVTLLLLAAPPACAEPSAEAWLQRIETAADAVDTLASEVIWITENMLVGDQQGRLGKLLYQAQPTRFKVDFTLRSRGPGTGQFPIDHTLVFTGQTLVERRGEDKVVHVYELAPEGEEADLDATDGGPFILPLNLKKDRVLKRFDVTVVPLADDAPKEMAVHLKLTPREGVDEDVEPMDIWFGGEHLLPLVVVSEDTDAEERTEFRLRHPQVNAAVPAETFRYLEPTDPGWQVELHPLRRSIEATE